MQVGQMISIGYEGGQLDATVLKCEETDGGELAELSFPGFIGGKDYHTTYFFPGGYGGSVMRRDRAYMPKIYRNVRLKDFRWDIYGIDTEAERKRAETFITRYDMYMQSGRWLYIHSVTKGSGKTMLACALGNELLDKRDLNVKFISAPAYIGVAREERQMYRGASLLILDDLGAQSESQEWVGEVIFDIINYRYENHMPMIITSNKPINKCSKDDRTFSRVHSTSVPLMLPEVSVRDKQAASYTQSFINEVEKDWNG